MLDETIQATKRNLQEFYQKQNVFYKNYFRLYKYKQAGGISFFRFLDQNHLKRPVFIALVVKIQTFLPIEKLLQQKDPAVCSVN